MIQFGVWAPTEQVFWDTWIEAGICSAPNEYVAPYAGCADTTSTAWDGIVYKNGAAVPGWHTNVRVYGDLEELMRAGKPQCDENGDPLSLWESTRAREVFRLTWRDADPETNFPAGYQSPSGVVYADINDLKSPSVVFG